MAAKTARKVKHVPQRTCVGCGQVLSKRQLIRIVRSSEGVVIDHTGKLPGRGAYLHDQKSCWVKALKGSLANALRTNIQEQDLAALRTFMETLPEGETSNEESMAA